MPLTPTPPPMPFDDGSFGALIASGEGASWPAKWRVRLGRGDSTLEVGASFLRAECQGGCGAYAELQYVRIGLDFELTHQGHTHIRHVEELFPASILGILKQPLDPRAPERFATTCREFLGRTDADLALFLANPISPMRLYEPALASLIPPQPGDTLDDWLNRHLERLLLGEQDRMPLVRIEAGGYRGLIGVREWRRGATLRTQGELKMVGQVRVECPQTGGKKGEWSGLATVVEPCAIRRAAPAPKADQVARLEAAALAWCSQLQENLRAKLEAGRAPILLHDVVPKFDVKAAL